MARVLFDDLVEFDDGTPATTSQMAKDVVHFLCVQPCALCGILTHVQELCC